jgi:S-formylglutathione hydrolase FrmB
MPRIGLIVTPLVAALLLACAAAPGAHASERTEITIPDRNGEIADQWLPGYPGPPRARVLLPDGYNPAKPYPLLVLLAGLNSNYRVWSEPGMGQIAKTAAGFDGIIVMPEGGSGWYADWWNGGRRGSPSWESYELDQVIPQILDRYRIRPERRWHALAGVSMGGLGTAYLGGRLPGFFGSIAVISGLVDGHLAPGQGAIQSLIPQLTGGASIDVEAVMGPENGFYSYGHDPMRLAANLRETRVYMAVGNGQPTSDGEPNPNNVLTDLPAEATIIRPASDHYAAALAAAGVDLTYAPHAGIHDWANFRPELRDAIAWGLFQPVDEHPTSWVNDTVASRGKLWEFGYRFDVPPDRIVRIRRTGRKLSVGAAGSAVTLKTDGGCVFHVATPAVVDVPRKPCAKLRVKVRPRRLHAGRWRRLRVTVTPGGVGRVVRSGRRRARADAAGVAYLRLCAPTARVVVVTARAPGFSPASAAVGVRGRTHACRSRRAQ